MAAIFLSALSLLQCQYAKKVIEDLDKSTSTEESENIKKSSSSETQKSSSSKDQEDSNSENKRTRKEAK